MADIKTAFKEFFKNNVLLNMPSYRGIKIDDIEKEYNSSFPDSLLFEAAIPVEEHIKIIEINRKSIGTQFELYSKRTSSHAPKAILGHYIEFLKYYDANIELTGLQNLINIIHEKLGVTFCKKFQDKRKELNGNKRTGSNSEIYGAVRDDYWTINYGAEREIQYHMFFQKTEGIIGYGLAFNAQPSINNPNPIEKVAPYIEAFFELEHVLRRTLYDYRYIAGSEDRLQNISSGDFVCIGKTITTNNIGTKWSISGLQFLSMLYDMKYRQFEAYRKIFQKRNAIIMNAEGKTISERAIQEVETIASLLQIKKQIILQGAPGTGKTYTTAAIAVRICDPGFTYNNRTELMARYKELTSVGQIAFTTFHQSMDYEEFVEGLKPVQGSDSMVFEPTPGIFKRICNEALASNVNNFEESYDKFTEDISEYTEDEPYIIKFADNSKQFGVTVNSNGNLNLYTGNNLKYTGSLTKERIKFQLTEKSPYWVAYYQGVLDHLIESYNLKVSGRDRNMNYVLIIDEINRGNISKILGELITLLEVDKRVGKDNAISVKLPYSHEDFTVPDNLYIIGTMNTADRSLGYIDYAIRRRFAFYPLKASEEVLKEYYAIEGDEELGIIAVKLFNKIKSIICSDKLSPEFDPDDMMLGHSYFMATNEDGLKSALEHEIKALLREYMRDGILAITREEIDSLTLAEEAVS